MTPSFVKVMLSLNSKVPKFIQATVSSEKGICDMDTWVYFD